MNKKSHTFWLTIADESFDCGIEVWEGTRFIVSYKAGRLDLDRPFTINGETITFRALRKRLLKYKLKAGDPIFNARGQVEIGRELSSHVFGHQKGETSLGLLREGASVRIVSDSEDVSLLPWSLLRSGRNFLTAHGWSIALSPRRDRCRDEALPPSPRVLIVTPRPVDWPDTEATKHVSELEALLSSCNQLYQLGHNLQHVESWDEFVEKCENYKPHIIYYYGHGKGDSISSSLIFASEDGIAYEVPALNVAQVFRRMGKNAPKVAYINCCQGEAGGLLAVVSQLADIIPAVITNCTTAYVEAARKQALSFWDEMLIAGKPPHEAITSMRYKLDKLKLSYKDLRWITPIMHYSYRNWSHKPTRLSTPTTRDLNWRYKLDRVSQFNEVYECTEVILERRDRKSLAVMVHGQADQGIKDFYERLENELPNRLKCELLETVRLDWPKEFLSDYHLSFSKRLCKTLGIINLDEIRPKLEADITHHSSTHNVLLMLHTPINIRIGQWLCDKHLERLSLYLDWLDKYFVRSLPANVISIIVVGFTLSEGIELNLQAEELKKQTFELLKLVLLEELGPITRSDLERFMYANGINLPGVHAAKVIDEIINDTRGAYEKVIERVKRVEQDVWRIMA